MKYRVSRKEKPIPVVEFDKSSDARAYARSFGFRRAVPVPTIEKINDAGEVVGCINLNGQDIVSAHVRATAKYDKEHTTGVFLKLNNETDKDILGHLSKQENKQGYIKALIRKDMERAL